MAGKIKGLTVEIGGDTTKLGKALDNVSKKGKSLTGELREVNRLLKVDPGNTDLLAQKQEILAQAISNTKSKLDTLRQAEQQVQQQFARGEASAEQVRELQREIAGADNALKSYKRAAQETADQIEQVSKSSDEAADSVDKQAEAAKDAEAENKELGSTLADTAKKGFAALAAAATAAVAAVVASAESTREYRTAMGKLNTAFETNNFSAEAAYETYSALQSILGETDQAVEAANHLSKLANNEEELAAWTEICTGVFAQFGDSLPIEGLTEAANETAKVGRVVGPLADAINWATADSKQWAKALRSNSKALAAFEKATADGESAEDAFNAALAACSDEQERQKLITSALTDLYKDASKAYKTTNKDVIEANKATERWNNAMAKVGGYMEPAVTAVKNLGASLLEDAQEPLKKVAEYITGKLIPGLQSMASWVSSHIPQISGAVVGLTASLVAYKTATFMAELSTKGMTLATYAAAAAQKVLNTVMKASPIGLVMTAITAVTAGVIAYAAATAAAGPQVDVLTDAERKLMQAANDTAEAFRNQQADTDRQLANIGAQMGKTTELADELFRLADASGKVKAADESRVQFILNQLNSALGTEYQLVDGEIQRYGELKDSIYGVINAKTANMMLESSNAEYIAAVQAKDDALKNLVLTEKDYQAQLSVTKQAEQAYADLNAVLQDRMATARTEADYRSLGSLAQRVESLRLAAEKEKGFLNEKKSAYDDAAYNYGNYTDTIINYEEAQAAIMEGNYERALEILKGKDSAYQEYADGVDDATAQAIDALFREAIDAGLAAERIKENFENGVEGYTAEMVREAEEGYEAALEAYANARADAEGVGSDIGEGLAAGMDSKQGSLVSKARSLVANIIASMRAAAESHSPSKATMRLGDDMGEGLDIGLEEQTEPLVKTAKRQIGQVVAAYEDGSDLSGADVFRGLAEQQTQRQTQATALARSGTDGKLDKILAAIERGQILTIDGDLLVGGTADRYDRRLGQQRALAARGAV